LFFLSSLLPDGFPLSATAVSRHSGRLFRLLAPFRW